MPPIAILVALADPTRCRIVEILRDGPQPVHVLAGSFKISRPAISRHLRVLKQAKLISEKKLGRENRYALHPEKLKPVGEWIAQVRETRRSEQAFGKAGEKSASKQSAKIKAVEKAQTTSAPLRRPEDLLAGAVVTATAATKPKREAPISQMGFDF